MSGKIQLKNEVQSLFQAADFIAATCLQINKDLLGLTDHMIKPEVISRSTNSLDKLMADLKPILAILAANGSLQQFIYKVDLAESKYLEAMRQEDMGDLAFSIIRREAQKVYLKKKYS